MIYTPRSQSVEAAPVELAGQRLMAVAVDGKAHMVDAGVFETLFTVENSAVAVNGARPMRAAIERVEQKAKKAVRGKPESPRVSEVAQRCLEVLQIHGPLTSAELRDHIYRDLKDPRKRLQNFSALSLDMRRRNLIERRTNPSTQLDQWHLCEGA